MFECISPRRFHVSHAMLYAGYGRFLGALLAGQNDFQTGAVFSESELPTDMAFLKAFTRRLMLELKKETNQNQRFVRFSSRLAKKLVCLGQLSNNELRTSFNLGLSIEISNTNWLLNGSPWNNTREVATSTDSFFFEIEDSTRSLTQDQSTETERSYCEEDLDDVELEALNQHKIVFEDSTLSESPDMLDSFESCQCFGPSESSFPSEPICYAYPENQRLSPGKTGRFNYPYRAPSTESGFNMRIPDSLVFLHKDPDFMYKKSSLVCCTPDLKPRGGSKENNVVPELGIYSEDEDKPKYNNRSEMLSGLDSAAAQYGTKTYELEPDDEGMETILVMPDSDPLTHYEERINTVEHIHDQLRIELEGALKSAVDISEMASYIANAVNQERGERSMMKLQAMGEFKPRSTKQTIQKKVGGGQQKSKIPIPISNLNRKFGSAGTSAAPIGNTPSGEPKSETDLQMVPEISSYRRKMVKTPRKTAKRWVGTFK